MADFDATRALMAGKDPPSTIAEALTDCSNSLSTAKNQLEYLKLLAWEARQCLRGLLQRPHLTEVEARAERCAQRIELLVGEQPQMRVSDPTLNAERWLWWREHMKIARNSPTDWTCWLELEFLPMRSQAKDVDELTDQFIARYPRKEST